jgi:hypothetical protein
MSEDRPDRAHPAISGQTIRWTIEEGPLAGSTFEHAFGENGTVVWRGVEGPGKCPPREENAYAALKITEDVYLLSYLASNGFTHTFALDFGNRRLVGFASNETQWHQMRGTFEILQAATSPPR